MYDLDLGEELELPAAVRNDSLRHMTFLRHPIDRLREQVLDAIR
jgi:hypothetical protein